MTLIEHMYLGGKYFHLNTSAKLWSNFFLILQPQGRDCCAQFYVMASSQRKLPHLPDCAEVNRTHTRTHHLVCLEAAAFWLSMCASCDRLTSLLICNSLDGACKS